MDILSRYTYHCSVRTLAGANGIEDNHSGYWRDVYLDHGDDRVDFNCGGTSEISSAVLPGASAIGATAQSLP